jgi:hypothetical protein
MLKLEKLVQLFKRILSVNFAKLCASLFRAYYAKISGPTHIDGKNSLNIFAPIYNLLLSTLEINVGHKQGFCILRHLTLSREFFGHFRKKCVFLHILLAVLRRMKTFISTLTSTVRLDAFTFKYNVKHITYLFR